MQRAYATSQNAAKLLAETEIVMGEARTGSSTLPDHGAVVGITLGTPQSLDVLAAPRQCEIHIAGQSSRVLNLTPRADATIQTIIDESWRATDSSGPQPEAPTPNTGLQRGK